MAERVTRKQLYNYLGEDGERKDAILNPTGEGEAFATNVALAGMGAVGNVANLIGNVIDVPLNQRDSSAYKLTKDILADKTKSKAERLIELSKVPFTENDYNAVDAIFGDNATSKVLKELKGEREAIHRKQQIGGQYSGGHLGELASELFLATPIMRYGSMQSTSNALKLGLNNTQVAKSIAIDSARNAGIFGTSEFALAKAYGRSDEEAMGNAIAASALGLVGTPFVGAGKTAMHSLGSEERALRKNFEEGGSMAGGGKPPEPDYSDIGYSEPKTKPTEAEQSKRVVSGLEFDVVNPKAVKGEELVGQTFVPEVKNSKRFQYKFGVNGRVYNLDANLLAPQGTSEQKASLKLRNREVVDSAENEVNRRLEFYDNESALRKAYGQTQTKFKRRGTLTKSEELSKRSSFEEAQYRDIISDDSLQRKVREEAKEKLKTLRSIDSIKPTDKQMSKAKEQFSKQYKLKQLKSVDAREKDINAENALYVKSLGNKGGVPAKGTLDLESEAGKSSLVSGIKNTLNRTKAVEAIDALETKEKLRAKDFDYRNITDEQRKLYRDEVADIEDFFYAKHDLAKFKRGEITPYQLRFRAKRRLDEQLSKAEDSGKLSKEEADELVKSNVKAYADIGVHVQDTPVKVTDISKRKPRGGVKVEKDNTAELEKAKKIHDSEVSAIAKFRKTGVNPRRTSKAGDRGGQLRLSKQAELDVKEGILSDVEIANKTSPNVLQEFRKEAIDKAREFANRKSNVAKAKELGITKPIGLPKNIKFKDTVVDASNSVMQVATVLLGNSNLAKMSKLFGGKTDVREVIASELTNKLGYKVTKDIVKPVFMTKNYGQGDKGLIRNLMKDNSWDRRQATDFLKAYYDAEKTLIPELKQLQELVQSRIKSGKNPKMSWTLPDGLKVELNLSKKLDGTYSIKGKELSIKIESANIDEASRALMPNIIHSVDAYVARRLNKQGIPTVHDAFQVRKGMESFADKEYTRVMTEINDSNLLDDILKQLEIDTSSLPSRDYPSSKIAESKHKLGMEHEAGSVEPAKARTFDVSKANTSEEVMRDYMASSNVRQLNTNQLIDGLVNESSFRTMSKATDVDDVFERQVAMAHQSPNYNEAFTIKAPDGVNEKMFNDTQRNIFNEARAKLEYNPLLRNVIQGERKYFDKQGKIVGSDKQMYDEFLQRELRNDRRLRKSYNSDQVDAIKALGDDWREVKAKVERFKPDRNLTEDELTATKHVNEAKASEPESLTRETKAGVKKYFTDQYKDTTESKAFTRLFNLRQRQDIEVNQRSELLLKEFERLMKNEDKSEWTKHLLNTDFHSIRHLDKDSATEFAKEFDWVYQRAKKQIDQGAKALNNESQQIGAYLNNARLISDAVGLGRGHDVIIDKLISIKAMSDDSWKFIEAKRGTELFEISMDVLLHNRKQSAELFKSNPEAFVKGFVKEFYDSGKQIVDQKVIWDAEAKRQSGVIPSALEAKKVGKVTDRVKIPYSNFSSREAMLLFAEQNSLKVTDKGFRQVQNLELRNKAGRSDDFARLITETSHSIDEKVSDRKIISDILDELDNSDSLISSKPKQGFREITLDERNGLPYSLQGKVRYVHEDYIDRIMGRDEVRLTQAGKETAGENQLMKVADRLLSDFVSNFKQNVVLKNVSSFKNAILVNQTIGAMAGVNPVKSYRYHKEAFKQIRRNDNLRSRMAILKATGKDFSSVENKLKESELYQMEQLGLALNQLDGVRGDSTLLAHMLSDFTGGRFDKIANELLLNQKSRVGRVTTSVFSTIDTQGRYTVAKQFMNDGLSMQEAVNKANGLFSDMGQMAPVVVEAIDKYGAVPFLKWYTLTSPQLMKLAKDNPKKTAMLSVSLYALSSETDMNFSTVNPIEAMVDFAESAITLDYLEAVSKKGFVNPTVRKLTPYVVPNAWQDIDRVFTDVGDEYTLRPGVKTKSYNPLVKDRIGAPWSEDSLDYRGFTQKTIQGDR